MICSVELSIVLFRSNRKSTRLNSSHTIISYAVFWSSDVCRSEEHTSELQSHDNLVCRLLLEKKKIKLTHRPDCARSALPAIHPPLGRGHCAVPRARQPAGGRIQTHSARRYLLVFF